MIRTDLMHQQFAPTARAPLNADGRHTMTSRPPRIPRIPLGCDQQGRLAPGRRPATGWPHTGCDTDAAPLTEADLDRHIGGKVIIPLRPELLASSGAIQGPRRIRSRRGRLARFFSCAHPADLLLLAAALVLIGWGLVEAIAKVTA